MNIKLKESSQFIFDSSTLGLLLSNVIVIVLAVAQKWDISTALWVYWPDFIIIGFFNFLRILSLKHFSTENFEINHQPASPTTSTKLFTAFFFLFHYGFFHFIYAIFLSEFIPPTNLRFAASDVLLGGAIFFANHFYSFLHNRINDQKLVPNIGSVLFAPYKRIIPMHLTLIVGALFHDQIKLILFLGIKTVVDLVSHTAKHQGSPPARRVG